MKKNRIELPLIEPVYSTYHNQGAGSAILVHNPSIRNWYLNQVLILTCNRKFLKGFTTPEISIVEGAWNANPYLEKKWFGLQFLRGHVHYVIRNLLEAGYYVTFNGIDDYYVEGKSWYRQRHFPHDGCICGYDPEDDTYCIYAYDQNWIYRKFKTPKKCWEAGRKAMFKVGCYGNICGLKPKGDKVVFSPETARKKLAEYLDSDFEKYPEDGEGPVYGIVVHDYIAKYVGKLYDGSIPYEKMDRRVFRLIWEHKKVMLERIRRIEEALSLGGDVGDRYEAVVKDADMLRMLYASHHMKRRDSVLPVIQKKLLSLKACEQALLTELLANSEGGGVE